jgi:secondary thiamine-phosphate synthase enzyme
MIATLPHPECLTLKVKQQTFHFRTQGCFQFIDLTDSVQEEVQRSGILCGMMNIQTLHTTTALFVNENEPLLLEDLKQVLERLAPSSANYWHNDFTIRTQNLVPGEDQNGHSHCKAFMLRTSETLNVVNGAVQLGPWQRIFLAELDKERDRTVSIVIVGLAPPAGLSHP